MFSKILNVNNISFLTKPLDVTMCKCKIQHSAFSIQHSAFSIQHSVGIIIYITLLSKGILYSRCGCKMPFLYLNKTFGEIYEKFKNFCTCTFMCFERLSF